MATGAEVSGEGGKEGERKQGPDEAQILLSLSCPQDRAKEGGREGGSTPSGGRKRAREEETEGGREGEGEREGRFESVTNEKPPALSSIKEADAASSPATPSGSSEHGEGVKKGEMMMLLAGVAREGGREDEGVEAAAEV